MITFAVFIIAFQCSLNFASSSLINRCDEPPALFPFSPEQFSGKWYVFSNSNNGSILDCLQSNITLNSGDSRIMPETINYVDKSNKIQTVNGSLTLDKWTTGQLVQSLPQSNWFLRLFGVNFQTEKMYVVGTDYISFAMIYKCNKDSWLKSFDEYTILTRSTNLNIVFNAEFMNYMAKYNDLIPNNYTDIATFGVINHANPACSQIKS